MKHDHVVVKQNLNQGWSQDFFYIRKQSINLKQNNKCTKKAIIDQNEVFI